MRSWGGISIQWLRALKENIMFTTPTDYFKTIQTAFSSIPKSPAEAQTFLKKVQSVVELEANNAKMLVSTMNKVSSGDASLNEISSANKKAQNLFTAMRFATVMAVPGAIFMVPALSKIADQFDFDFVPESVKKEFSI